jgi:hypothetical protein
MSNITHERAIAKHAGVLPSQLRKLSTGKYFVDINVPLEPLCDARYDFTVEFSQILIGTIADVGPAVNA